MPGTIHVASLSDLALFAAGLAAGLRAGDCLALTGPVGAGKTTLVRALARALGAVDEASSPSFTIWQHYEGSLPINHLDLYRLENPAELQELGLEEAFTPHMLTIVEWPEHGRSLLPPWTRTLHLEGVGEGPRSIRVPSP